MGLFISSQINNEVLRLIYQLLESYLQKKGGPEPILNLEQNDIRSSNDSENFKNMIDTISSKYQVDPKLVQAVVQTESNYRSDAVSPAGAQGLMQLMPETARELGVKNSLDAEQNLDGGVRYLRKMLEMNNGNVAEALAAYNAGPGSVRKFGGIPPFQETRTYVKRVLDLYDQNNIGRA
jgi:soluble lytic murein transglycosylase-like protein